MAQREQKLNRELEQALELTLSLEVRLAVLGTMFFFLPRSLPALTQFFTENVETVAAMVEGRYGLLPKAEPVGDFGATASQPPPSAANPNDSIATAALQEDEDDGRDSPAAARGDKTQSPTALVGGRAILVASNHRLLLFGMERGARAVRKQPVLVQEWYDVQRVQLGLGWTTWVLLGQDFAVAFAPLRRAEAETFLGVLGATPACSGRPLVAGDLPALEACLQLGQEESEEDEDTVAAKIKAATKKLTLHVRDLELLEQHRRRALQVERDLGVEAVTLLNSSTPPTYPPCAFVPISCAVDLNASSSVSVLSSVGVTDGSSRLFFCCLLRGQVLVCEHTFAGGRPTVPRLVWGASVDDLSLLRFSLSRPLELVLCWDPEAVSTDSDAEDVEDGAGQASSRARQVSAKSAASAGGAAVAAASRQPPTFHSVLRFGDGPALTRFACALNQAYVAR